MKRLIACASLVAVAGTAASPLAVHANAPASHTAAKPAASAAKKPAAKTVAKAAPKCRVAPADEYFGRLKMSILGIRNTIKDQGLKIDADATKAPSTLGAIALTEDAIHDWQHKYPCDSWLPGTLLALERFYGKIHTDDGVKRVHATFAWLRHDFPKSAIVATARREDGQATAVPPGPATAVIPTSASPGAAPATNAVPADATTASALTSPAPFAAPSPHP